MYRNTLLFFHLSALFFILLFSGFVQALTFTTTNIHDLTNYLDNKKDTLIFFDIDSTIITNAQYLGGDHWYHSYLNELKKKKLSPISIRHRALEVYNRIQKISKVKPVDKNIAKLVKNLQKKYKVFGLTARGPQIKLATAKQLKSVNVNLNLGLGKNKAYDLGTETPKAKFHNGIIFADGEDKGTCMKKFLEMNKIAASKIIFIDDLPENVTSVAKASNDIGAEYVGLNYVAVEQNRLKNNYQYKPEIAQIQFEFLNNLISDEEAKVLLNYRKSKAS